MQLRQVSWQRILVTAGVVILAMHLLFALLPNDPEVRSNLGNITVFVAGLAAMCAMLFAAWTLRVLNRRIAWVWVGLALAQLFSIIGDGIWLVVESVGGSVPNPSLADLFYLLYYPTFLVSILILPVGRRSTREWVKVGLDILIVMMAAGMWVWNALVFPSLQAGGEETWLAQIVAIAYPAGDLLLLWALLMILYSAARPLPRITLLLLASATAMLIIVDSVYTYQVTWEIYQSGRVLDVGYTLVYLTFAFAAISQAAEALSSRAARNSAALMPAALMPAASMPGERILAEGVPAAKIPAENALAQPVTGWLVYIPFMWAIGAYLFLLAGTYQMLTIQMQNAGLIVGLIFLLVLVRQGMVIKENQHLLSSLRLANLKVSNQAEALEQTNREMQGEIVERRRAEERLSHDALHDSLTGLPNRSLLLDRLAQAGKKRHRNPDFLYSVLFLDLDSFKVINDSLGHITGDRLLVATGRVLTNSVRETDTVARLGGDEFVILLEDTGSPDHAIQTANRLQTELSRPLQVGEMPIFITVSIGIVLDVKGYESPEEVLRDADLAMYNAKSRGKARYSIFDPSMRASVVNRLALENDLRHGLEQGEFSLHYQPIVSLPDQRLVGYEALVRWRHPERGLVEPSNFIPLAEETGLILPLGKWILEEACRQASEWRHCYPVDPPRKMNVNISGRQLQQPGFVSEVVEALRKADLPGQCLALEVTESVCLSNMENLTGTLEALQRLGVEIEIDDFGTGYSSLSYLQRLPIQSIKIDKSFIHTISPSGSSPEIIRAIISIANDLGIRAVAEGIETETQAAELSRLHCDYAQGYWLARPMDCSSMERWLVTNHTHARPAAQCETVDLPAQKKSDSSHFAII